MATSSIPVQFRISQEPTPSATMVDDLGPVPSLSPDGQSFVVIRSAADLDKFSDDDGEISDISLLHEHKQLLQHELEQFELLSTHPQPLLAKSESLQANENSTSTLVPIQNGSLPEATTKPISMQNGLDSEHKTTSDSVQNGSDSEVKTTPSPVENGSDPGLQVTSNVQNGLDPEVKATFNKIQNGSDSLKSCKDMNQSILPAMPQPHIYKGLGLLDDDENRTISIASFAASDFGSEEIQAKVTQLIDENMHLKDIIIQNSTSMKAQYERIAAWHKDVERRHEIHKEKFREARNYIEGLRKENATLRQEIDSVRQSLQLEETEHEKTKQLLTETSQNKIKEFELDAANKIKELEEALQKVNLESEQTPPAETYQDMEKKLARYERELENAYKQIRDLAQGDQERSEVELKLTQEKLLLSEMANDRANMEIDSLRNQLARKVQIADDVTKLQLSLDEAVISQAELHTKYLQLQDHLRAVNEELRARDEATKDLKDREEEAKIEAWRAKQQLAEMEQMYLFLQGKASAAPMPLDYNPNEQAYLRQQLMHSQKALTECDQNRAVADARSVTLNNEVVELRKQLAAKQDDIDNMFALRAQLDVYKADFEAEQEAKEEIKRENSRISNDLQLVHRRNQQLQEEVELLRDQLQQYGHHQFGTNGEPTSSGNVEPIYKCPKCNFSFQKLREVEAHVNSCIDLDDSLP